ncbi:MAG: hypothetical protein ABL963_09225 [Longimicrobiales bacterium]
MVIPITSLWLPILIASVLVFIMSSIIHMFFTYHRNDYSPIADEDRAQDALRALDLAPGEYMLPYTGSMENMRSDTYQQRIKKGPVVMMTVMRPDMVFSMGSQLTQWFAYTLLVGIVVAYVGGRFVPASADYLQVFRLTGTVAFACYSMALMQRTIWFSQSWVSTLKSMFDGLLYALLTAGAFAWLWPA